MKGSRNRSAAGPRGARVQELCRDLNDTIAKLRYSSSFNEYVCECRRKSCLEVIRLSPDDYAEVRSGPDRFVVLAGHVWPAVERVTRETSTYQVVERLPHEAAAPASPTKVPSQSASK